MSSRRRQRRRTCTSKRRYPTAALAARAAQAIAARTPRLSGCPLRAYPCRFCAGWHIGHRPPEAPTPEGSP